MKGDEAKRGFYALGDGLKRCHTETEWLFENGIEVSKPTTFVDRKWTFVCQKSSFVGQKRGFCVSKMPILCVGNRGFVCQKAQFRVSKIEFRVSKKTPFLMKNVFSKCLIF